MFQVKFKKVEAYYLKGTTWTLRPDMADKFASHADAQAALNLAYQFMAAGAKRYTTIEITS